MKYAHQFLWILSFSISMALLSVQEQSLVVQEKKLSLQRRLARYSAITWAVAGILSGVVTWMSNKKCSSSSRALVRAEREKSNFYTAPYLKTMAEKEELEQVMCSTHSVETINKAKKIIRNALLSYRLHKSAELRPFVVAPKKESNDVFERVAWIITQISVLSTKNYCQQRGAAASFLEERMQSIKIDRGSMLMTLSTDRPYEMQDAIKKLHDTIVSALSAYGSILSLKKPDALNQFFLEVDRTFVFKIMPIGMAKSIIIKIPVPYAYLKLREQFLEAGLGGESNSVRRNADRVLIANAVRKAQGSSCVTAPRKFLARRQGNEHAFLDDSTTVVMTECVDKHQGWLPKPLSAQDLTHIKELAIKYQRPDIHPWNIIWGSTESGADEKSQLFLIDLEKSHAKWQLTEEECCQYLWSLKFFF